MSDFPQYIDVASSVISTNSKQSLGVNNSSLGLGLSNAFGTWPVANTAIYVPFRVGYPVTVVKIFWQNGTVVSGNVDVGVYDSEGNRLVSSGSTAQTGTSVIQSVDTADIVLQQGSYYMAMAMDNTTGAVRRGNQVAQIYRAFGVYNQTTAFGLPTTATYAGTTNAYLPFMALTTKTVI